MQDQLAVLHEPGQEARPSSTDRCADIRLFVWEYVSFGRPIGRSDLQIVFGLVLHRCG
jgi:hypothetical protein